MQEFFINWQKFEDIELFHAYVCRTIPYKFGRSLQGGGEQVDPSINTGTVHFCWRCRPLWTLVCTTFELFTLPGNHYWIAKHPSGQWAILVCPTHGETRSKLFSVYLSVLSCSPVRHMDGHKLYGTWRNSRTMKQLYCGALNHPDFCLLLYRAILKIWPLIGHKV